MIRRLILILLVVSSAAPAPAADRDLDGGDDASASPAAVPITDAGDIAVVDIGEPSVSATIGRLLGVGLSATAIPPESTLEVLADYGLVILPVSHASIFHYHFFADRAADYHAYVQTGGGLWVSQPNPIGHPGGQALIPWLPYELVLEAGYTWDDCPADLVEPDHCITEGLTNEDLPSPIDQTVTVGGEWEVLMEGAVTGSASVLFAAHGAGKILVELGNPGIGTLCGYTDAAVERFVACTIAEPVATEGASWSALRSRFR